jgi:hypothetical protein
MLRLLFVCVLLRLCVRSSWLVDAPLAHARRRLLLKSPHLKALTVCPRGATVRRVTLAILRQ